MSGRPRVLVILSHRTYRSRPFVAAAGRLDLALTVATDREQVFARDRPDDFLLVDLADPGGAARRIAEHARRVRLDGVVAADDDGVLIAAHAARALGLPGHPPEAAARCRDKLAMRRALAAAGRPGPRFAELPCGAGEPDIAAAGAAAGWPCVVKPRALSASRGVTRADDPESLVRAVRALERYLARPAVAREAGASGASLLVESYLAGPEVAVEGLVAGGRLDVLALFDKPDPMTGPHFEETIYVTPSSLPGAARREVEREAAAVVRALGLGDGAVHLELRVCPEGPVVLELAPRSIGGLCAAALRFDTSGIASRLGEAAGLEELILLRALGEDVSAARREGAASGVLMLPVPGRGTLKRIDGLDAARRTPGVTGVEITIPVGQEVVPLPEGDRYLGFVFARGVRADDVVRALGDAHERLRFVLVSPGTPPA